MNMRANNCPCCGSSGLLRHVRHGKIYWFCQACRQEVMLLTTNPLVSSGGSSQAIKAKTQVKANV